MVQPPVIGGDRGVWGQKLLDWIQDITGDAVSQATVDALSAQVSGNIAAIDAVQDDVAALDVIADRVDTQTYDVRKYGAVLDGVTDGRTALLAAIAAAEDNGGTVLIPGYLAFTGLIEVPGGVNLIGIGTGQVHGTGSKLICLDEDAQIRVGDLTLPGTYGGLFGNITIDGNDVSTDPLVIGMRTGSTFQPMYVINAAAGGAAVRFWGSQNNVTLGLRIEGCGGDGLVFDRGAGGNNFYGVGISDCDGWQVKYEQTGASPIEYVCPSDNRIYGYMIESHFGESAGLVYHGAGDGNAFYGGFFALPQHETDTDIIWLGRDDAGISSSGLKLHDASWFGAIDDSVVTGINIEGGSTVILTGTQVAYYLKSVINAEAGSVVQDDAFWSLSSSTFYTTSDATPIDDVVRNRRRSMLSVTRELSAQPVLSAFSEESSKFTNFEAGGTINWNNEASLYNLGSNAVGLYGSLFATGGLGVGNSAAATTPGTVTHKIEVFDETGTSLGFVAVYDAIT